MLVDEIKNFLQRWVIAYAPIDFISEESLQTKEEMGEGEGDGSEISIASKGITSATSMPSYNSWITSIFCKPSVSSVEANPIVSTSSGVGVKGFLSDSVQGFLEQIKKIASDPDYQSASFV